VNCDSGNSGLSDTERIDLYLIEEIAVTEKCRDPIGDRGTFFCCLKLEHRAGIEPANTGFADQRVSHFATGA
jgi:hypothetical protein